MSYIKSELFRGECILPTTKSILISLLARIYRKPRFRPEDVTYESIRRILVVRPHDMLGDFLLSTPVLRALRGKFPQAHIAVLAGDHFSDVVLRNPFVDEILVLRKGWRQWDPVAAVRLWRQLRAGWNLAVVLNTVSHSLTSDLLAALSCAPFVLGPDQRVFSGPSDNFFYTLRSPVEESPRHQTDRNLDIVRYVGVDTNDHSEVMGLDPSECTVPAEELRRQLDGTGRPLIAIHPGAGKLDNRWPVERFARLAELLHEKLGAHILVLWGPDEHHLGEELCRALSFNPLTVAPGNLRRLAAIFTQCDLLVCNDTGIMHVAAASGVPLVALFGPTDPRQWKPAGEWFVAVIGSTQTMDGIAVESVYPAVVSLLQRGRPDRPVAASPGARPTAEPKNTHDIPLSSPAPERR